MLANLCHLNNRTRDIPWVPSRSSDLVPAGQGLALRHIDIADEIWRSICAMAITHDATPSRRSTTPISHDVALRRHATISYDATPSRRSTTPISHDVALSRRFTVTTSTTPILYDILDPLFFLGGENAGDPSSHHGADPSGSLRSHDVPRRRSSTTPMGHDVALTRYPTTPISHDARSNYAMAITHDVRCARYCAMAMEHDVALTRWRCPLQNVS